MTVGLEVRQLSKSYASQRVVDNVSLAVPDGQFVCFLGPSGCGKTTLLRMIAGLETPSSGRILMNDKDITDTPVHERNFAMVFQALALFPFLNVEQNIAYSLRFRTINARQRHEMVRELLTLIKLPDIGARSIEQLSGGQRQRVAIARALAQEPMLFCWMNRCPRWMPICAATCRSSFGSCSRNCISPLSWSLTISAKR